MATDVIMPQMGESIFEGTITKWLKKPGEKVQRDEPLFEISTDKVDAEIPSPVAGVLKEIKVAEGATVQVNTVVGVIAAEGEAAAKGAEAAPPAKPTKAEPAKVAGATKGGAVSTEGPAGKQTPAAERHQQPQAKAPERKGPPTAPPAAQAPRKAETARGAVPYPGAEREGEEETEISSQISEHAEVEPEARPKQQEAVARQKDTVIEFPAADRESEEKRVRSSPLVRRIARENNINLEDVKGTGLGGRISKQDIMAFVEQQGAEAAAVRPAAGQAPRPEYQISATAPATPAARPAAQPMRPAAAPGVDMTRIAQMREREKVTFEQRTGNRLTFMPFFARAAVNAIEQFPIVNASVEGDNIHYKREINLGIAVALDWGLIVPVVRNAEEKNFLGLQRAITDLGERARTKKLLPEEVQGGTFTITNPGSFGALFGTPIIMQPQVAILGVGGIIKAPIVVSDDGADAIAIRSIVHLVLGFDHRVIDGAVADKFMALLKKNLENWSEQLY